MAPVKVTPNVYSFVDVAFHVLHKRILLYPFHNLTAWFKHRTLLHRWKVVEHFVARMKCNMEMIDQLDLIGCTSEFTHVFTGLQYRVESLKLRVAKPLNDIPASTRVHQLALECIPRTQSWFYTDPVVVPDFHLKYLRQDKWAEPGTGERVQYVIVYGSPGLPLIQLVRRPLELISDPGLSLNATDYITKQILPPLDRFLFLLGVDVFLRYRDMLHLAGRMAMQAPLSNQVKKTSRSMLGWSGLGSLAGRRQRLEDKSAVVQF